MEASKLVMRTAASRVGGAVWSRMKFRKRNRKACDDSGGEKGDEAFRKRDVDWESEVVGGWI